MHSTHKQAADIPSWALQRPKRLMQSIWDLLLAPLRMAILPDAASERWHLTSLRAERFSIVLPQIRGRLLDVGAGDNSLCRLYEADMERRGRSAEAKGSVGVDTVDWGGNCTLIESSAKLPFPDASFDTVTFVACINHIPERREALIDAVRILRPGGRILITMIGRVVGEIGHRIWWYSEDKHREVEERELMGMDYAEIIELIESSGLRVEETQSFVYGLNRLYIATVPEGRR